jgi:hypothetical protein
MAHPFSLLEVAFEMAKRRIGSAIILHHEKLAGILSATDICRILAELLESEFSPHTGGTVEMDDPTQHGAADDDFRTRTSGTGLSDCLISMIAQEYKAEGNVI